MGQKQDADVMVEAVAGVLVEEEALIAVGEGAADQHDGAPKELAGVQLLAGGVGVVGGHGRSTRGAAARRPWRAITNLEVVLS
ncbi:hypothetical protein [Streptomyces bacillaris]